MDVPSDHDLLIRIDERVCKIDACLAEHRRHHEVVVATAVASAVAVNPDIRSMIRFKAWLLGFGAGFVVLGPLWAWMGGRLLQKLFGG